MYRQFNIQQFYVLPTQCVYVFVWIWEQTAIISLYSINWLFFNADAGSVYRAVRTGSLYRIQINFSFLVRLSNQFIHPCTSNLSQFYQPYVCFLIHLPRKKKKANVKFHKIPSRGKRVIPCELTDVFS